jgi:hypothetical protein
VQRINGKAHQLKLSGRKTTQGATHIHSAVHHMKVMARGVSQGLANPRARPTPISASLPPLRMAMAWPHAKAAQLSPRPNYRLHHHLAPCINRGAHPSHNTTSRQRVVRERCEGQLRVALDLSVSLQLVPR